MKEYNIEIVGACNAGKSALTMRVVQGIFVKNYDPLRADLYRKRLTQSVGESGSVQYQVNLYDTAGKGDVKKGLGDLEEPVFAFGQGFMIVYDLTSEESYLDALDIMKEIVMLKKDKKVPMVLVGNKLDLESERRVNRTTGAQAIAGSSNMVFLETSAKENTNVLEAVQDLVKLIDKRTGGVVPKDKEGNCVVM